MGKIMHGGINYSGSGGSGSSIISLTQAQYDELTPEEKMDPDKVYYISDGVSPGSINYLGVFIDEDNVIQSGTSISGVTTYTATEDCAIVVVYSATTSAQSSVDINDVTVLSIGGANVSLRNVLLAKKGDVVKFTPAGTYNTYYVYGLKHGSSTGTGGSVIEPNPEDPATDELTKIGIEGTVYSVSGVSAVHYDDTERIIGTFFGETLYRKTIKIASLPSSSTGSTYPHGISDIKDIWAVYAFAKWQSGAITPMNMVQIVGGNFIVNSSIYYSVDKTNITINPGSDRSSLSGVVTIEYTKTTS